MNYSGIIKEDISNGPGIRLSLFVSGCPFHCKGCFNEETWNYQNGSSFSENTIDEIVKFYKSNPQITGFSLLGGEPFAQGSDTLLLIKLIQKLKEETNCCSFWVWSGYTFEKLIDSRGRLKLLLYFDVLVDGRFEEDKKDLRLPYCGSTNQRVIDVQESLKEGKVVLWEN